MTRSARQVQITAVSAVFVLLVISVAIWSPLQRGSVARKDGQIFISEVNYRDVSGLDSGDYLEIHNGGTSDVSLNQWCISGVDFCFQDNTVLAAGATVVVPSTQFDGKLNNEGESLELRDSVDNLVDEVKYSSVPTWAYMSAGRGHTLHRNRDQADAGKEAMWITDVPSPGGIYNPTLRSTARTDVSVVVSEIHFHPENDNPQEEFVEIVNVSDRSVGLQNWCLQEIAVCFEAGDALAPSE
ncbi:MAG: hypothetical protein F2560_02655, partial [Actinobacteria bacterium]|nr:hypothetical protein [Actinomycetota bacterium]